MSGANRKGPPAARPRLETLEASLLWLRVSSRTASGGRLAATLRVVLDETLSQSSNSTTGLGAGCAPTLFHTSSINSLIKQIEGAFESSDKLF
jgi:hypothetical protein